MHYVLGEEMAVFMMLFADDGLIIGQGANFEEKILLGLLSWLVWGYPIKWEKTKGGFEFEWIGYWLDLGRFRLGISEKRANWLLNWVKDACSRQHLYKKELEEVLGRWSFAGQVLDTIRPFLGPIYAWCATISPKKPRLMPAMIRLILHFIASILGSNRSMPCSSISEEIDGEIFKTDAGAEREKYGRISIGGWKCKGGTPTMKAKWFSFDLNPDNASWAYDRNQDPSRMIATFELIGTLVATMVFCKRSKTRRYVTMVISGGTDNKGNGHAVDKYMSTAFPLTAILMELAVQLARRGLALRLVWHRREFNVEADDLTNGNFERFDMKNRIPIVWRSLDFMLLPEMISKGRQLYREVKLAREAASSTSNDRAHRGKKGAKLRQSAPWDDDYVWLRDREDCDQQ
jgi:hypothetical protein